MQLLKTTIFLLIIVSLNACDIDSRYGDNLVEKYKADLQAKKWELSSAYCDGSSSNNFAYSSYEFSENDLTITIQNTVTIIPYTIVPINSDGKFNISLGNSYLKVIALGKGQMILGANNDNCYSVYE